MDSIFDSEQTLREYTKKFIDALFNNPSQIENAEEQVDLLNDEEEPEIIEPKTNERKVA